MLKEICEVGVNLICVIIKFCLLLYIIFYILDNDFEYMYNCLVCNFCLFFNDLLLCFVNGFGESIEQLWFSNCVKIIFEYWGCDMFYIV